MGAALFGWIAIRFARWLRSDVPLIVLKPDGIVDNGSAVFSGVGFIPWSDVDEIRVGRYQRLPCVEIVLGDREKLLARLPWPERPGRSARLGYPAVTCTDRESGARHPRSSHPEEEPHMHDDLLTGASPKATEKLIEDWTAHVNAADALEGITPEQAVAKLDGWPYSIAEQVAHMLFWQRHSLEAIDTGAERKVASAAEGWPAVAEEDWPRIRDEFLAVQQKNKEVALEPELLAKRFGDRKPYTVGVRLLIMSTHDSYHLGQVVMMRRLLGAWPPPGGGDTW